MKVYKLFAWDLCLVNQLSPDDYTLLSESPRALLGFRRLPILCSQLLPYFLHLSAPTRDLTRQQRLWKWEIGQQVAVTQDCVPLPLLQLSQAPLAVPAAFPNQLMTAARWTGGACGTQQISWTQATGLEAATREVHSFPSSTSPHLGCVVTRALRACTASPSAGHWASKGALHITSHTLI